MQARPRTNKRVDRSHQTPRDGRFDRREPRLHILNILLRRARLLFCCADPFVRLPFCRAHPFVGLRFYRAHPFVCLRLYRAHPLVCLGFYRAHPFVCLHLCRLDLFRRSFGLFTRSSNLREAR